MMNEKEKLLSLKEGLEIVKKYDDNKEFNYIDSLLKDENDDLNKPVSPELFTEMVHSSITSYTNTEKSLKK